MSEFSMATRPVYMQLQINHNWTTRRIDIPLDTPEGEIDRIAGEVMEKVLRDEYKNEHSTYYEAVVSHIGVYDLPHVKKLKRPNSR